MAVSPEVFRTHLQNAQVLEPFGKHHELSSGRHGEKIDFDRIPNESPVYQEWVDINAEYIEANYPLPTAIVGVANGANRLALDVARRFNGSVVGLVSEKPADRRLPIQLTRFSKRILNLIEPELVVVLENVCTTGTNAAMVAREVRATGAEVRVLTTWKRSQVLDRLVEAHVPYDAIIDWSMQTYTPEECTKQGFCAQGIDLIPKER